MVGIRVAPDNNDIVVWKFDDAGAPFVNSSTSTNAISPATSNLTTLSGTVLLQQPSLFAASGTNSCVQFTGNNSASPRNFISGANTVNVQPPVTFSCWLFIRTYDSSGFTQHYFSKQHTAGVWSPTFAQVGFQNRRYVSQPTAFDLFVAPTTGGGILLDSFNNVPINAWCHVGITYDGSTVNGYLNGDLVGTTSGSGNINYGGNGPWFFGAIPSGSGNPEEPQCSICDFRIANIVRPQSYFQDVYRKGVMVFTSGNPTTILYKLRAYDTSCSIPTAVYWVSQTVDYADAPTAPCGSLGPIEIVESWEFIGSIS